MIVDTSESANAKMTMLPTGRVRLSGDSPFGQLYRRALDATIPSMGDLMFDPHVAHAYDNFLVASGAEDGVFVGPGFMDGDFYKWLESAVVANADQHDQDLLDMVDKAARAIAAAQAPDGYLHTKTTIAQNDGKDVARFQDRMNFETYNLGHLMTLASVHHRITGSDALLGTAIKVADYLIELAESDPDTLADSNICPSHYMGAVELYRTTKDDRYRQLAGRLLELHGGKGAKGSDDNQDVLPVREQRAAVGHAVRANYLYAGMADYALETEDDGIVEALEAIWKDLMGTKIYVTGGCGALYDGASPDGGQDYYSVTRTHQAYGRPFQLPQTTAYNESCAGLGLVMWAWRMLALTADGTYADAIERVMYNALPAMIGADGKSYFYINPLRQVSGYTYPLRRSGDLVGSALPASDDRPRQEFMKGSFCCPPNIARVLAEFPSYVYAQRGSDLWVHQYIESSAEFTIDGAEIVVTQETRYPAEGEVLIRVKAQQPTQATIRVRIPQWATGHGVTVNGEAAHELEKGYVVTKGIWSDDVVEVKFDMKPELLAAHHFVEEATGQVCVARGPVVYCVESADLPEGIGVESVALDPETQWSESEGSGIFEGHVLLSAKNGKKLVDQVPGGDLYARFDPSPPARLDVRLVPYALWANRGPGEMSVWLNTHAGAAA
jgi:DUF1680 family protein